MTARQWMVLVVLMLANGLVIAAALGLIFFYPTGAVFSHNSLVTQVVIITGRPTLTPTQTLAPSVTPARRPSGGGQAVTATATATDTPGPTLIFSATPTSVSVGLSATPTSVSVGLSATPLPSATLLPTEPRQFRLTVEGHPQQLPLSCEAASAVDWAAYFGVSIDELEFLARLPLSDNPDLGFVGDVNGKWGRVPPNAYGVHAEPVAALLRDYGVNADSYRDLAWEEAQTEIRLGRPIIVWVVGHVWEKGKALSYTAADGAQVKVAPYEHTVMLIGYDAENVVVLDGDKVVVRRLPVFLSSWAVLGNMAVGVGR